MAINSRGFTLLIAVIFMAVVLSLGLALGSLGYKQAVLAGAALESQYAFYAADAGLECALRADEQDNAFSYAGYNSGSPSSRSAACSGQAYTTRGACYNNAAASPADPDFSGSCTGTATTLVTTWKIPLAYANPLSQSGNTETRCAIVTIYKPAGAGTTYLFSQGYDVKCASVGVSGLRYASRGIVTSYQQ